MVAWWGLDTAGGTLWDSPSCRTSPAPLPLRNKSRSIRVCVCPPAAASASSASAWRSWPSPLSPSPQHSGQNITKKTKMASNTASKSQDCSRTSFMMMRGKCPHRWLHPEESRAVVWPTVTSCSPVAHTVQVVVERQLCVCRNISHQTGHPACSECMKHIWKHATAYMWTHRPRYHRGRRVRCERLRLQSTFAFHSLGCSCGL